MRMPAAEGCCGVRHQHLVDVLPGLGCGVRPGVGLRVRQEGLPHVQEVNVLEVPGCKGLRQKDKRSLS